MANLPKNPTAWVNNRIQGALGVSSGSGIQTQSGIQLLTQSGVALLINPDTVTLPAPSAWTPTVKENTQWFPANTPNVVNVGTENITDNLGNLFTDNLGNFLVTTPYYETGKNPTAWTATGAS
jgi:hypothetical protein